MHHVHEYTCVFQSQLGTQISSRELEVNAGPSPQGMFQRQRFVWPSGSGTNGWVQD